MPSTTTRGASIWPALEPLLEQVGKPIQYVGGELNSTTKDWNCGGFGPSGDELTVRWALMYPDAYEVGVPNQGVMILYEVLGVSFSTELGYTNLLTALDLAGMPLHTADRSEDDPLVIAGGHAAFNPEPIADFIDAAVIGDGEQAVLTITDIE